MADSTLRLSELRNGLIPALEAEIEMTKVKHAQRLSVLERANEMRQQRISSNTAVPQTIYDAIMANIYMSTMYEQDILRKSDQLKVLHDEIHRLMNP